MSLEHPGPGFNGILGQVGQDASLLDLDMFVRGYMDCFRDLSGNLGIDEEWLDFLEWLRPKGYFPTIGWAMKIVQESKDSNASFETFRELLFEYLETRMPSWFIEFNRVEQPSPWRNVNGPRNRDIRVTKHIGVAQNA